MLGGRGWETHPQRVGGGVWVLDFIKNFAPKFCGAGRRRHPVDLRSAADMSQRRRWARGKEALSGLSRREESNLQHSGYKPAALTV